MRDLLTGLAIVLIVVLTTLLVAPYFVDWNGQRGFLEGQLSRALGQTVTIGGNIDLKLLPTPYLRLNQAVIGSDDGAVRIGIRHLDLELSVSPLLHGEFDIVEGRLDEPTIRVMLQKDRTLPVLPDTPALRADVRLERIKVVDGTLAIADPQSGRTFVVDHLDFKAEAPSLAGPYKVSGMQGTSAARTKFLVATTAPSHGEARLRMSVDETPRHPALAIDGDVAIRRLADERARPSFRGTFTVSGHLAVDTPVAWRLTAPLQADPQSASFKEGQLRVGTEDNAVTLQAIGDAVFGDHPDLRLKITAQQLDIDRLAGAPINGTRPTPPKVPGGPSLARLLTAVTMPVPTSLDVSVEAATWGGETLNGIVAHLTSNGPAPLSMRLSGDGPGGLHLDVQTGMADADHIAGHAEIAAENLPATLRWLADVTTASLPTDAPVRTVSLASRFTADSHSLDFPDMTLGLDRSKFTGALHVTTGDRTKVSADLSTAALDLDALPDLRAVEHRASPYDVALKLDAGSVRIARAGSGQLRAGRVCLDGAVDGLRIVVKNVSIDDLGGASVRGSGSADETAAALSMSIDAARLEQATALARQVLPGIATDAFADRAAELGPAKLKIDAGMIATPNHVTLAPTRLDVTGTLAETRLDVHLASDPNDELTLSASAEAPHAGTLLGQFGLPSVPVDVVGKGRVSLSARGPREQPLKTSIDAVFGATHITAAGSFDVLTGAGRGGSGIVAVKSVDAVPLLQTSGLVPLDTTERLPVDLTAGLAVSEAGATVGELKGHVDTIAVGGALRWNNVSGDAPALTGSLSVDRLALGSLLSVVLGPAKPPAPEATWSSEPFASGLFTLPRMAVGLQAKTMGMGLGVDAHNVAADLGIAPNLLTLKNAKATLAGGDLTGSLSVRRDDAQASLEGSLALAEATLDVAPIKANLRAKLDFAGGGQTPLALVKSLAGSGQATFETTRVGGVNARALPAAFAAIEDDTLAVDDESIRRALEEASPGSLDLGTRHFAVGLAGGTLALTPQDRQSATAGPIEASLDGSFDVRQPRIEVHVNEVLGALPKDWTGPAPSITVRQTALAGGPAQRSFDVSAFTNAVAARAIARESARIESYEFDIRERSFFNARLVSERRREQDRLKAEADARAAADAARKAEADRKARAEAARLERQRQDREDRDRGTGLSGRGPPQPSPEHFEAPPRAPSDPSAAGPY